MSAPLDLYRSLRRTADEAVALVPRRANVSLGMAVAMPIELTRALADRARAGTIDEVRVYGMHMTAAARTSLLADDVAERIRPYSFFLSRAEREAGDRVAYVPGSFSQVARMLVEEIGIDVHMVTVSPMDRFGNFSCGTNGDYGMDVMRRAKQVVVEVNPRMPHTPSRELLHVSEVAAIVEHDAPLHEETPRPPTAVERRIAAHVLPRIVDGSCLQFGIGGVPAAIAAELGDRRDLGLHTELLGPSMVELIRSGVVTNRRKAIDRGKSVFNFVLGTADTYAFLHENLALELAPASYTNDPYVIGRNDHVVSVNAFLEIDLAGQVNAEFVGGRQFSAPGGQLDFVRGAYLSKGGVSILASSSTALDGKVSRIVKRLTSPVTDPRHELGYVATEYGIANLRGKSTAERARALIELAHPDFRSALK